MNEACRATLITGDVRDVLATIPDGSVDLVLTSPPFLALRSYLPADHPDKHREIGAEPTPAAFLSTLLALTAEWRRVLAPHGSICVELGDTYSGSGGAGGDYNADGLREGQQKFRQVGSREHRQERDGTSADGGDRIVPVNGGNGWPLAKSMCGIPHLYHLSLAYGRNLLTGEPCEPWRIRNVVAWCRPNPPVGSLGDKYRPATSYMTIATVSAKRYFDLDAVRGEPIEPKVTKVGAASAGRGINGGDSGNPDKERLTGNPNGAPPLDYWVIPTQPYAGSHYAVWPPALLERPIKSMVPARVCNVCGEPSRRIVARSDEYERERERERERIVALPDPKRGELGYDKRGTRTRPSAEFDTLGWTDCGHDNWRPGVVLDPFAGSGTTLSAATGNGHAAIGIDLDERNVDLARERVGPMFLDHYTLDEWKNRTIHEGVES